MVGENPIEILHHEWQRISVQPDFASQLHNKIQERERVRPEINDLKNEFLSGRIGVEEFRAVFDSRSRKTEWATFGLGGISVAMLLNQLVKHATDHRDLNEKLRRILATPSSLEVAIISMREFFAHAQALRLKVGRGLIPYNSGIFVSAYWHMDDPEVWPIFYPSGRDALAKLGFISLTADPAGDYQGFYEAFQTTKRELKLSAWELETLLKWQSAGELVKPTPTAVVPKAQLETREEKQPTIHTEVQLLLARLGAQFKCNVWIPLNDRHRSVNGSRIGDLSIETFPAIPGVSKKTERMIREIDIIWLQKNRIVAVFEIESTTSIYSGLLRMSDLAITMGSFIFPMYIAVPRSREFEVRDQLSRETFQYLEFHQKCGYFAFEDLKEQFEAIMRFAKTPEAIREIAYFVGDVASLDD